MRRFAYTDESVITSEAFSAIFNNESLADKTWHEAIESLLYATGLVLRYVGSNTFILCSLRDIPLYGYDFIWDVPVKMAEFCSYGNRELSPASKTIVDDIKFDIHENIAVTDIPEETYGASSEYIFRVEAHPDEMWQTPSTFLYMPVYNLQSLSWRSPSLEKSLFLNPFAYALKDGYSSMRYGDLRSKDVAYLACNAVRKPYDIWQEETLEPRSAIYQTLIGKGKYRFAFKVDTPVSLYDNKTTIGFVDSDSMLIELRYNLRYRSENGLVLEYRSTSNKWEEGEVTEPNYWFSVDRSGDFPVNFEFPECECDQRGYFELEIKTIVASIDPKISQGAYVQIKEIQVTDAGLDTIAIPDSLRVTTRFNDKNNLRLQRNVNYGFNMGRVASPKSIVNGLFVYKDSWFEASDKWKFNSTDAPKALSVLIHQQLLAYYAKPNNVLTGELATIDPMFNALYEWKGTKHLLTSGAINILTGRMENVILREFMRYDHMWEMWAEQEEYNLEYSNTSFSIIVHSNVRPSADDVEVPDWVTGVRVLPAEDGVEGVYKIGVSLMVNLTSSERTGIIKVGSLVVKVTQASNN